MHATLSAKVKERSIIVIIATGVTSIVGAIIAAISLTTIADSWVLTEAEHESPETTPHFAINAKVDAFKLESKCGTLRIEINLLDREVYDLSKSDPTGLRYREKNNLLAAKIKKYDDLKCVRFE